jgi:hypothetical protein
MENLELAWVLEQETNALFANCHERVAQAGDQAALWEQHTLDDSICGDNSGMSFRYTLTR